MKICGATLFVIKTRDLMVQARYAMNIMLMCKGVYEQFLDEEQR